MYVIVEMKEMPGLRIVVLNALLTQCFIKDFVYNTKIIASARFSTRLFT